MAPGHILQIFLRVTIQDQIGIAQRAIIDEIIQLRPLRHGYIQRVFNPGAVDGDFSPIKKRFGFSILAAGLPVDISTGWEPRTNKSPTCGGAVLFKSSSAPKKKNQYTLCTGFSWCRNAIQIRTISL